MPTDIDKCLFVSKLSCQIFSPRVFGPKLFFLKKI